MKICDRGDPLWVIARGSGEIVRTIRPSDDEIIDLVPREARGLHLVRQVVDEVLVESGTGSLDRVAIEMVWRA
jgi:anti-sigma regulatory factor (Ser/Thr protein kinase)